MQTFIEYRSHARQNENAQTWDTLEEIPKQLKNFYILYLDQKTGQLYTIKTTRKQEESER